MVLVILILQVVLIAVSAYRNKYAITVGARIGLFLSLFIPLVCIFFALFAEDKDPFGREHPIPDTLAYELPYPWHKRIPIDSLERDEPVLITHEGGQSGNYLYTCYAPSLPKGILYLKCFEVTENIPLSESGIRKSTERIIEPHNGFAWIASGQFTIHEGIWGEYYAVRVEAWFCSQSKERKLTEGIYKMEGWMR